MQMPQAQIEVEPFPFETFAKIVGGPNWVVARRTPTILVKYGKDVVCLTPKQYRDAECRAWLLQTEGYD